MTQTLSPLTMSCLRRQADASSALKPAAPRSMRERQEEVVMRDQIEHEVDKLVKGWV